MKLNENTQLNLKKTGVYKIVNLINNKIYIGSTSQSFEKRFKQHYAELQKSNHKNGHLQAAWNKYGEEAFEFCIIEVCLQKDCLLKEQEYMDRLYCTDKQKGYNINPLASSTQSFPYDIILKRSQSFKKTNQQAMIYYKAVKANEISIEDVPSKYLSLVLSKINHIIWNKGLTKKDHNYDHLKVPKTITEAWMKGRKSFSETQRNKSQGIKVFNFKGEFIKQFRSISDIVDYSKKSHDLPLILRTTKRKGYELSFQNINNVCNGKSKHYKGLIFRYMNSDIPVIPLVPSDINRHWKEFKLQSATSGSNLS